MAPAASECVRVVVRGRPLNAKETAEGRQRIVEVDQAAASVTLRPAGGGADAPKAFTFDAAFDCDASQREVYENTAMGIVNSVLDGYNGTIFAYGQTGTGKTHTMEGYSADPAQAGIIPQARCGACRLACSHCCCRALACCGGSHAIRMTTHAIAWGPRRRTEHARPSLPNATPAGPTHNTHLCHAPARGPSSRSPLSTSLARSRAARTSNTSSVRASSRSTTRRSGTCCPRAQRTSWS